MSIFKIFSFNRAWQHDKVAPNLDSAYCPDCGKLIKNEWYIARCACCGIKLKAKSNNGKISAENNYCSNCGSQEFTIEKLDQINFINVNFAILVKKVIDSEIKNKLNSQCWQEKTFEQPKLLKLYQ